MCVIANFVNKQARHHAGQPPGPNRALQAFIAAQLLRERKFGITSVTAAAIITDSSRVAVKDALTILQAEDEELVARVLKGRTTSAHAAAQVRSRARLVDAFRSATADDRIAFGRAVGPATLFDTTVMPAL